MRTHSHLRVLLCVVSMALCHLSLGGQSYAQPSKQPLVTQAVNNAVRATIAGNVHSLARAEFDRGEAPPNLLMQRMLLVLRRSPEQEAALRRLIEAQQSRGSSEYHRWLAPEEFAVRFGPSDSDIAAVVGWLKASGFEVAQVSRGRSVIEFSGSAGLVKQAFGTAIRKFAVNGEQHWANASDPSVPAALAPVVAGINSLHNFRKTAATKFVGAYSVQTKSLTSNPDFTLPAGDHTDYGVVPYDFAAIYNLLPLWNATPTPINGTGQTIAIVGRTDIDPTDADTFWTLFGLDGVHAPKPTLVVTHNGPAPGIQEDEGEANIDIQWSGAAAPGATVHFVTSESTESTDGVDLSALYIVDNNVASIVSESYGQCELNLGSGGTSFYEQLWEQAAAQGISVFVSTGDNGSAGCDNPAAPAGHGLNVNGLASTPFNVAVGGTEFNEYQKWSTYWNAANDPVTHRSANGYIPETTWNDSCTNGLFRLLPGGTTNSETNCNNPNFAGALDSIGGSGGKSASWLKPSWQTGTPPDNARDLPDVSLFASNGFLGSFYVVCQKDISGVPCDLNNFAAFGGTSVASPALAGIMALVNQKTGRAQGVPGFVLYKLAAKKPTAFHDIPTGSTIAMPCLRGSPNCTISVAGHQFGVLSGYSTVAGYDLATGLGSVDAANLVNQWNSVTFTPSTTNLTLNSNAPVSITHGVSVPVSVSVTPGSPAPRGAVALLASPGVPGDPGIDAFTLANGAANTSTTSLPGGNYSVIAHYSGDATYGGSYSNPVSVTVSPENSSVYMPGLVTGADANRNPIYSSSVVYASPYLLRADVKNSQGIFCSPPPVGDVACPGGSVTFSDNGSPLDAGIYTLNGFGYTEDQLLQLSGGAHTLRAQYGGDSSFNPSLATTVVTVTPASTSTGTLYILYGTVGYQSQLSVYVNTTSSGVAPTGAVTFYANDVPMVGNVTYTPYDGGTNRGAASLYATLFTTTSPFPTPGNYTISAKYSGDSNYSLSTAEPQVINVKFPEPGILFQISGYTVSPGTSLTLTATVISSSPTIPPTGTLTFASSVSGRLPGTPTYSTITDENGNLNLRATLTFPINASDNFTATYSGDANYPKSVTASGLITVTGSDFDLSFPESSMSVTQGLSNGLNLIVGMQANAAPVEFSTTPCSGLPAESTCSVVPSHLTYTSSIQVSVTTTAPHHVAENRSPSGRGSPGGMYLGFGLACVFLAGGIKRRTALRTVGLCALLSVGFGCGGGGSGGSPSGGNSGHTDPGTPTGAYTITVTGTSGTISHKATFTLNVQ